MNRKKAKSLILCLALIFTMAGCADTDAEMDNREDEESLTNGTSSSTENQTAQEIMAYIEAYDGQTVQYDEVEWVDVPSDRATELGLSEYEDAGFYVYNETEELSKFPLAASCVCTILDWSNNYEYREVSTEELSAVLKEREGTRIPYILTIQDHEVVAITECYVP
jgi:hypothetical protein